MRRRVLVLLLLSCLGVPLCGAAAPALRHEAVRERGAPDLIQSLGAAWDAITSFLSRLKDRGSLDPNGQPASGTSEPTSDDRGSLDPNG
jgi:hypothetical protein